MTDSGYVVDPHGHLWLNRGEATDDHLAHGGHEPAILAVARSLMPKGGVFLDVGAHVGLYTINLRDLARKVYAIEANSRTADVLAQNIELNQLHRTIPADASILIVRGAAWDSVTTMRMEDENGKATGSSTRVFESEEGIVPAFPLDGLNISPDLVKIDVEGAEAHVLRGLKETIDRAQPTFLIEMHDEVYDLPEVRTEVLGILESHDYEWSDTLRYSVAYYIVAKPKEQSEVFPGEVVKAGSGPALTVEEAAERIAILEGESRE